jgi:large subunit ribosomal protein L18
VYRSTKHIYAQLIDDDAGVTVAAASSLSEPLKGQSGGNITGAKSVGTLIASQAQDKGIKAVVFDRGGFRYHGRVKSLAEAARAGGLEF